MTLRKLYPSQTPTITSISLTKSNLVGDQTCQDQRFTKGITYQPNNQQVPQKFSYLDPTDGWKWSQTRIHAMTNLNRANQKELWQDKNYDTELKFSFNREWETIQSSNRFIQNQQVMTDTPCLQYGQQDRQKQRLEFSKQVPLTLQDKLNRTDQNPLKEVQNTFQSRKTSVGSIKRNKTNKQVEHEVLKEECFINSSALDDIQNIRMSKLKQMNDKLNKVLNKENICKLASYNQSQPFQTTNSQSIKHILHPQVKDRQPLQSKLQHQQCLAKMNINDIVPYLDRFFDYLDRNKVGMLSKSNCYAGTIPQELKFVFGSIFTKIILKNLRCNRREFTKLCLNALKQIDSLEIIDILQKLFSVEDLGRNKSQTGIHILQNQSKHEQIYLSDSIIQPKAELREQLPERSERHQDFVRRRYHEIEQPPLAAQIAKEIDLQPIQSKLYPSKRQDPIPFKAPSSQSVHQNRKSGTISQSVLMQHRKSLQQLNDLDLMMSKILNTKHLGDHAVGGSQSESLQFSELVKHI